MALLNNLRSNLQGLIPDAERIFGKFTSFIRGNPIVPTAILSATATGTAVAVASKIAGRRKRKKSKRKKVSSKRKRKRTKKARRRSKRKRIRRTPYTAGKGKDRSTKRIRYTKKGQPYVITRSGKAKFIKKSSAKRSHKLKGGRY